MEISPFNPTKVLLHKEKIDKILNGEIPSPVSCEIDPSDYCNDDCVWCMFKGKHHRKNLSREVLMQTIEELADEKVKSITFTGGGEPLMNPYTPEAIELAVKKGVEVGLVTNGGRLNNIYGLKFLRVSIDAGKDETYYKLHRPKNKNKKELTKILKSTEEFKKRNPQTVVGLAYLIDERNVDEIGEFISRAGFADYVQFRPVLKNPPVQESTLIRAKEWLKYIKKYERDNFKIYGVMHRFDEINRIEHNFEKCLATPLLGIVQANGDLAICCQQRYKMIIGNLYEKRFFEIWGSEKHKQIIKQINPKKCPVCRYIPYNEAIEAYQKDKFHYNFL